MKQLLRKQLLMLAMVCATTAYAQTTQEFGDKYYYDWFQKTSSGEIIYDDDSQDAWITSVDVGEWDPDDHGGVEIRNGGFYFGGPNGKIWGTVTSPNFDANAPMRLELDLSQSQSGANKSDFKIIFNLSYIDINGVSQTRTITVSFDLKNNTITDDSGRLTITEGANHHYAIDIPLPEDYGSDGHTRIEITAHGGMTIGASAGSDKIDLWGEELVLRDDWDNTERLTRNANKQLKKVTVVRSYTKGWYTLSLPFDLTMKQFQRRYMAGFDKAQADSYTWKETTCAEIWHYDSFDEGSEVMHFRKHDANDPSLVLEAGVPYLIYVPGNIESTLVDFIKAAGIGEDNPDIHVGDKVMVFTNITLKNPAASVSKVTQGSASFTSNLGATDIAEAINGNYVYYLHTDAEGENPEFYAPGGTVENATKIKGFRAYVSSPKASGAKKSLRFSDDNVVTAIDKVDVQSEKNMPIINLQGQHMNGDLKGLPRGIYIMNGKKYVIK